MSFTDVLIIGAGQCGLAMSYELSRRCVDHVILEAGHAGESWRSRRWPSLRLLTPNWMNVLAGQRVSSMDPDAHMTASQFTLEIDAWVSRHTPPIQSQTVVHCLRKTQNGFVARTSQGTIRSRCVVLATGACAIPRIPGFAAEVPRRVAQLSPLTYRGPDSMPEGHVLVVGSSASGLQIARELALSGRPVTLSVGNHSRLPRSYRGADILTWMHLVGAFNEPFTDVDDLERVRRTPSLPLIGSKDRIDIDLNTVQRAGVEITGRLADIRGGKALFSGALSTACASADLKMNRLLDRVDAWIEHNGFSEIVPPEQRYAPTRHPMDPRLTHDLNSTSTIVWCTGFTPDHRFVQIPVFDRKGRLAHHGGYISPGLYAMGLPYLRNARSVHIDGAHPDAQALAPQLLNDLTHSIAA